MPPWFRQPCDARCVRLKKKAARHLHRDGAGALCSRAMSYVGPCRAENSHSIETGMFEKTPILNRKNGFAQHLRNIVEAYGPALLARSPEQAGQQLRFYVRGIHLGASIESRGSIDLFVVKIHDQTVLAREERIRGRTNFNFIAMQDIPTRSAGNIQLTVAGALQMIGEVVDGERSLRWKYEREPRKCEQWFPEYVRRDGRQSSARKKSSNKTPIAIAARNTSDIPTRTPGRIDFPKSPG